AFKLATGATCVANGPAALEVIDSERVRLELGALRSRVFKKDAEFAVDTELVEVIDLGTDFGVRVGDDKIVDVVVFDGKVRLNYRDKRPDKAESDDLTENDGLRVTQETTEPIRLIDASQYPNEDASALAPRVIDVVTDSHRPTNGSDQYRVVRGDLREGSLAYVDRSHRWKARKGEAFPEFLVGADYVMTFNVDKTHRAIERQVRLVRGGNLYVMYDDRLELPEWLTRRFTDTRFDIAMDEFWKLMDGDVERLVKINGGKDRPFSVWHATVPARTTVRLGGVDSGTNRASMYGIAATPSNRPPEKSR
ncbi:MAG: FecR domain-containing protein, partial [Planctomycetota bacterium]